MNLLDQGPTYSLTAISSRRAFALSVSWNEHGKARVSVRERGRRINSSEARELRFVVNDDGSYGPGWGELVAQRVTEALKKQGFHVDLRWNRRAELELTQ